MAANGGTTESRSFANHWFSVSGGFTCQLWKMTVEEASGCISGFLAIRALPSSNQDHSCETPFHENGQHRPSLVSAHPGAPPAATAAAGREAAEERRRGASCERLQQGPATHGRMPPQSTDNPETGLNRDSFGTVAHPAAPPDRRASSRRTRMRPRTAVPWQRMAHDAPQAHAPVAFRSVPADPAGGANRAPYRPAPSRAGTRRSRPRIQARRRGTRSSALPSPEMLAAV